MRISPQNFRLVLQRLNSQFRKVFMKDIKQTREKINEIDAKIRELFTERMEAARDVAEYKAAHGLPVCDAKREAEVIEGNVSKLASEELKPYYVSFLRESMAISRNYQDMLMKGMKVAYSGVTGAFAYIAARKLFPSARYISYPNFERAYEACVRGECDIAVLPIENSCNGEVGAVTDLMFSGSLKINGITEIDITHCLLGCKGATLADIKKVISHPQALAQCKDYIRSHEFLEEEFENTAMAAEAVAAANDTTLGAIASEEAARLFGLEVLEKNINASRSNTTRFAVFSRSEHKHTASESGIHSIILFTVKNEAGALAKALDIIGKHGFNMRALRSRPMKELLWQYYFYVEAEGNAHSREGARLLEDLSDFCDNLKCVGTFTK